MLYIGSTWYHNDLLKSTFSHEGSYCLFGCVWSFGITSFILFAHYFRLGRIGNCSRAEHSSHKLAYAGCLHLPQLHGGPALWGAILPMRSNTKTVNCAAFIGLRDHDSQPPIVFFILHPVSLIGESLPW